MPPLFIESLRPELRSPGSRFVGTYFGGLFESLSMLAVTSPLAIRFEKDCLRPDFIGLDGL